MSVRTRNFAAMTSCLLFSTILVYAVLFSPWFSRHFTEELNDQLTIKIIATIVIGAIFIYLLVLSNTKIQWIYNLFNNISIKHIFIIGLLLRLIWVVSSGIEQIGDFNSYNEKALEILRGDIPVWINPMRPIGPSIFFYWNYYFFGYNQIYPLISIAFLSSLQILIVYKLLILEILDKNVAICAAILLTFCPEHILYTNQLGSNVIYTTCILGALLFISLSRKKPYLISSTLNIFGAGVVLGISLWIRPVAPLFIFASGIFLLFDKNPFQRKLWSFICFLIPIVLSFLIILHLNKLTLGVYSPTIQQGGGWSLLVGTNIKSHGEYDPAMHELIVDKVELRKQQTGEHHYIAYNKVAFNFAFDRLKQNYPTFLSMAFRYKIIGLWGEIATYWSIAHSRFKQDIISIPVHFVSSAYHLLIILLCVAASFRRRNLRILRWNTTTIYIWAGLLTTLTHFFLEVMSRYHHPFIPLIIIYGATYIYSEETAREI